MRNLKSDQNVSVTMTFREWEHICLSLEAACQVLDKDERDANGKGLPVMAKLRQLDRYKQITRKIDDQLRDENRLNSPSK